jgi:lauroyl/myristoyl acyltransferase
MSAAPETWQERTAYLALATVAWLGRVLPTHTGRMLFGWLGAAASHLMPNVRRVVADNQAQVLGRTTDDPLVQASTSRAFRRYARYWFDAFDVVDWTQEQIGPAFVFERYDHLEQALAMGKGVIAVLPHMGNWDVAGRALLGSGLDVVAVAEHLRPERLYQLFVEHRQALGIDVVALSPEGKVGRQLADALKRGSIVALLADRDLTGRGVEVQMFGAPRRLPAGPALLALSTGAPIMGVAIYQTPTGWRCVLHEPFVVTSTGSRRADAERTTQRIASMFERDIAVAPDDWHLFQPGWD